MVKRLFLHNGLLGECDGGPDTMVSSKDYDIILIENDVLKARLQDLAVMVLDGRDTREDEPVRNLSQPRFMKALAKASLDRIRALEAALRKCAGELHNYHSIAGDEALDAAHEALGSDRMWALIDKCPNCSRHYSRRERASIGADEEYCCGMCKIEAEAPSGHPQDVRFHPSESSEP